jgi:hypothetical protein
MENLDIAGIIIGSKSHVSEIKRQISRLSVPVFELDGEEC